MERRKPINTTLTRFKGFIVIFQDKLNLKNIYRREENFSYVAYEALYTRGRPKTFSHLVGQDHISNALTHAINSNRLSHAYLLVGTRGTGKTSTARLLAKAMNCDFVHEAQAEKKILSAKEIPCNKCKSCLSINSSPDNVEFDAASNRSVEDVTRLLSTAHLAPLQSRIKTFIIDEVHMLSFEAVNSILKLIEEPPPNVAFFLATTELQRVPMTIRSRCQVLNFRLIPQESISDHLKKFAKKLNIELEEAAAKKIARLAEGSMRDALTYLDQCYSMADKKISLVNVNETLGLISDADLDEIISAVRSKDRSAVSKTLDHAFRSGLTSISIAESLIARLRDLEFEFLVKNDEFELQLLENFVEELRKTILEMNGSGIPDIILEMALMKFSAPKIIFSQPTEVRTVESDSVVTSVDSQKKIQAHVPNLEAKNDLNLPSREKVDKNVDKKIEESLDETSKFFYDMLEVLYKENPVLRAVLVGTIAEEFVDDELTISFKGRNHMELFLKYGKADFENWLLNIYFKRKITVKAVLRNEFIKKDKKEPNMECEEILNNAAEVFDAVEVKKISGKE